MTRHLLVAKLVALVVAAGMFAPAARAQVITTNGGFESGLTGWTVTDQVGSDGTFFAQTGTTSPSSLFTVPAPFGGTTAAMSDGQGPGSHVIYQDFAVPNFPIARGELRFFMFIGNRAHNFFTPGTPSLDFSTPALNQQVRVDLMSAAASPFSVAAPDILFTAFQSNPGDGLLSGYVPYVYDVTTILQANLGQTLRIRFAEVDNVNFMQLGIDNVSVAIPEPGSLALCGFAALAGLRQCARRRNNSLTTAECQP